MYVRVYYSLDHLFPQHGCVAHRNENCNVCMCILFPSTPISLNMEWVAHINEICNVCMCILFPWSPIFPTWRGLLREMRIAMSVRVYYSFYHLFPQHGGGCSQKWEMQCVCVYYSLDHLFPQTWRGLLTEIRIAMSVSVYYSFDHLFPQHGGGCSQKWELQCLYVYIIPLITYFPDMEGFAERNVNCNVCVCLLFLWSPISPTWRGLLTEKRIAMPVCVYYSLGHLFPQHGGGYSKKRELQCLYVYIIPLITNFPNMDG